MAVEPQRTRTQQLSKSRSQMPGAQSYQNSWTLYQKTRTWHQPMTSKTPPLFYDQDGTLNIEITTDGRSVWPNYGQLARELQQNPTSLLNISIWNWDTAVEQSLIIFPYLSLLHSVLHRWKAARIDALLFNYLIRKTGWINAEHPKPHHFQSLTIQNVARAGDIAPLNQFLKLMCYSSNTPFYHLELCDSLNGVLSLRELSKFPFNWLRVLDITHSRCSGLQIHELLISGIYIEQLYVSDVTGPSPDPQGPLAAAVNLQVLKVELDDMDFNQNQTGWIFGLLQRIATPFLKDLTLGYENEWCSNAFAEFHRTSNHRLEVLCLEKMGMSASQFLKCLNLNPFISELALDTQEKHWKGGPTPLLFTEETCPYFMVDPHGRHLVPELEKLVVRNNCIQKTGCFGKMIKNIFTHGALEELVILGKELASGLHREDQKVLHSLGAKGLILRFEDS